MKARLLVCGLVLLSAYVNGQNKTLGVGVDTPNPNAALHVESPGSNQGFIMPRLTTAQRTGMATLLTATDNGLMLYDTDEKILYIWDGAAWKSSQQVAQANLALAANKLTLPYADVNTNAPNGSALIDLSSNPANAADVVSVAQFSNLNAGAFSNVLKLNNSGTGAIMIATSSGGGSGGVFQTTNATNGFPALRSSTTGTGNALRAQINNTASTADAFFGTTNGTGTVIRADHNGTAGYAGVFQNINAANNTPSLFASTASNGPAFRADTDQGGNAIEGSIFGTGTGSAGNFTISNAANSSPALFATTSGTGNAITAVGKIQATQFIGDGSGLTGVTVGANSIATGQIIDGTISDADINSAAALSGTKINPNFGAQNIATTGRSFAGKTVTKTLGADTLNYAEINNPASIYPAILAVSNSDGGAGAFLSTNTSTGSSGLYVEARGNGPALDVLTTGTTTGARFIINNGANNDPILQGTTIGTGSGIELNLNTASASPGILINKSGGIGNAITADRPIQATQFIGDGSLLTGISGGLTLPFTSSNADATSAFTINNTSTTGSAASFNVNNASATSAGVLITTNGGSTSSTALRAETTGGGYAGEFNVNNTTNARAAVRASTNANSGPAIQAVTTGGNSIATFQNTNAINAAAAVDVSTNGTGRGLRVTSSNTANGQPAFDVSQAGTGSGASIANSNTSGSALTLNLSNAGSTASALNISHAGTGNAITANRPIQATQFIGDGSLLTGLPGGFTTANAIPKGNGSALVSSLLTDNGTSVGLGTASPSARLHISGTGGLQTLRVQNTTPGPTTPNGDANLELINVNRSWTVQSQTLGNFQINDNTAVTTRFHINTVGNVGIGTITPSERLDVTGNIRLSGALMPNNLPGTAGQVLTSAGAGLAPTWAAAPGLVLPYSNSISSGSSAFYIANTGTGGGLYSSAQGTSGSAGIFTITDVTNGSPALQVGSGGTGIVFSSSANGSSGQAGRFHISGTTNSSIGLESLTGGTGSAGAFTINNTANNASVLSANTNGNGSAATFTITQGTNTAPAINISHAGSGNAITANRPIQATDITATGNLNANGLNYTWPAAQASGVLTNNGSGGLSWSPDGLTLPFTQSTTAASPGLTINKSGTAGSAVNFAITNPTNPSAALEASSSGTGDAVLFEIQNLSSIATTMRANNPALGKAAVFDISNASNSQATLVATTGGTGSAGDFSISNASSSASVVEIYHLGTGNAINANANIQSTISDTDSEAGRFVINNSGNTNPAIWAETNGDGGAILARATGTSQALVVQFQNPTGGSNAVDISTDGLGSAAGFSISNSSNSSPSINAAHSGTGPAISANQSNNGLAFEVINGGIKLSYYIVNTPGSITQRAGVYEISGGGGTYNLPASAQNGELAVVYATTNGVTVNGTALASLIPKIFVKVTGSWLATN